MPRLLLLPKTQDCLPAHYRHWLLLPRMHTINLPTYIETRARSSKPDRTKKLKFPGDDRLPSTPLLFHLVLVASASHKKEPRNFREKRQTDYLRLGHYCLLLRPGKPGNRQTIPRKTVSPAGTLFASGHRRLLPNQLLPRRRILWGFAGARPLLYNPQKEKKPKTKISRGGPRRTGAFSHICSTPKPVSWVRPNSSHPDHFTGWHSLEKLIQKSDKDCPALEGRRRPSFSLCPDHIYAAQHLFVVPSQLKSI